MSVKEEVKKLYIPTIGIETHVQLKTRTKLFSAAGNDARDASPNSLISHIDVGMPGALPVLNEGAIELASLAAFALNTEPQKYSYFERKHYFYPDLPMGYQISQLHAPIIVGGYVEIEVDGQKKKINLNRAQLEADAGKNTHPDGADYSLVDLNRVGTPLIEIVSEPEIHSAAEAKAYVRELYLLMKYAAVSDVDLYHGNMRFDVNVSVSKDPNKPGKRTETKNLNSFKSVENAVLYEVDRQIELLESGGEILQETRGWDEAKQKTTSQRSKEEAQDYRYMPEPDIPPVELDDDYINKIKKNVPMLPRYYRDLLKKINLSHLQVEELLESEIETDELSILHVIELNRETPELARSIANWFMNFELPLFKEGEMKKILSDQEKTKLYKELYDLSKANRISSNTARRVLESVMQEGSQNVLESAEEYIKAKGWMQVSDTGEIEKIVAEVLAENEKAAEDVKNGEMKAIGFLVGQVMKKSHGKANPQIAQELIKKQLGI
jgi:aspartyl-tRNA(Asn)/glutamyl-tRNA(Gln) amidotransferase subunit B